MDCAQARPVPSTHPSPDRRVAELAQGLLSEGPNVQIVLYDEDAGAVPVGKCLRLRDGVGSFDRSDARR